MSATPPEPSKLDRVLADAELGLSIVAELGVLNPAAAGVALLLDKVLHHAQVAIQAHEAITGKPLDSTALHPIAPVE